MRKRRALMIAVVAIAVGMILAPVAFQMFRRAPQGGDMIESFQPFMTVGQIEQFDAHLSTIRATYDEVEGDMSEALASAEGVETMPSVTAFVDQWPTIDADMTDLVSTMEANLDNFGAIEALPTFDLFPWFFLIPGALILAGALWAIFAHGRSRTWAVRTVFALGVAVALAPFAFQMFTRAPQGGDMVSDFEALMTRERVQDVQRYFIVLGAAEGQLRTVALPAAFEVDANESYPATEAFIDDWQTIFTDFAPTIGTMSDNVDNFAAVAALPPFDLFPWFFLIPGLMVAGLALAAGAFAGPKRSAKAAEPERTATDATAPNADPVDSGSPLERSPR